MMIGLDGEFCQNIPVTRSHQFHILPLRRHP
jgi:hypothetical protein